MGNILFLRATKYGCCQWGRVNFSKLPTARFFITTTWNKMTCYCTMSNGHFRDTDLLNFKQMIDHRSYVLNLADTAL